jgi:nitric oxide reductase subunit B
MTSHGPMTVSPLWLQGSILTFVFGFAILTCSAIRIYQDSAPIPERIVDESGTVLATGQQIRDAQEQFLTYGLMQFGTIYGHGAYLGPDFTADYLHRMAVHMTCPVLRSARTRPSTSPPGPPRMAPEWSSG